MSPSMKTKSYAQVSESPNQTTQSKREKQKPRAGMKFITKFRVIK